MRTAPGRVLVEDLGRAYLAALDVDGGEERAARPPQAAANTYRIAFGPYAGLKVLTCGAMPREHQHRWLQPARGCARGSTRARAALHSRSW
jgi:hypothetical protein